MATTAAGTPYVESSDLVANYPGVSLALANHIDTIGKVLQVVRATDVTMRSTTSTSYVDVTGMSITITPQKSTSAIMIIVAANVDNVSSVQNTNGTVAIADSSNNIISGTGALIGIYNVAVDQGGTPKVALDAVTVIGWALPATISAVTYKARFKSDSASNTMNFRNNTCTGQMFAIEVAA